MADKTEISWTDHTFNPWLGCTKVSPACDHCYAESWAKRSGLVQWGPDAERRVTSGSYWTQPAKWNRAAEADGVRRRVFCGSLCDVMEERDGLYPPRELLYKVIEDTPHLDWLLLTKRPQNFLRLLPASWIANPLPNVWGMTTVESPEYYWRINALARTPFAVRGLSIEPLLAKLDLAPALEEGLIHWVIVGGESGPKARPMNPEWVRHILAQCRRFGVPFHMKQWGEWEPIARTDGFHESPFGYNVDFRLGFSRVGKKAAGHLLDGVEYREFPAPIAGASEKTLADLIYDSAKKGGRGG